MGHVIALDGPHMERPDFDWHRALTRFLWLMLLLATPFLLLGGVLTTLGGFSFLVMLAGIYFLLRFISPMNMLAMFHLFTLLNPMGDRAPEQQTPVRYLRIRGLRNGAEHMARIKGTFETGHIMQEDLVSLWGSRKSGMLQVHRAYNHRTNTWIAIQRQGSWVGLVLTLLVMLFLFAMLYEPLSQLLSAINSPSALSSFCPPETFQLLIDMSHEPNEPKHRTKGDKTMSNNNTKSNPDKDRATNDASDGRYNPPSGTSWCDIVTQQVLGESQANKDYREAYQEEKRRRG